MNGSMVAWKALAVAVCFFTLRDGSLAVGPLDRSRNLLQNAAFEQGLDGWRFEAWKNKAARAVRDPNVTHNGRPSIRVDHPEATDSSVTQILDLKPNKRYRLSGWVKTQNIVKPAIASQRPGDEGASIGILAAYEKSRSVLATQDWTYVSMDFTTTKEKTHIRLGPRLGHHGKLVTGTAWFAEMSLVELPR